MVLLVGLSGDSETENTYREQLETWLDLLARSSPPPKLLVLCERPEALVLPTHLPGKALPGNRTNFLALARMLAGDSNSVLVVAWGHGGRQGATPVFHVRGPRLTPGDFATVAAALPASNWILLFRGSGAFARQLAAEGREVLSSECDTMFTSDPIGMPLLLKALRGDPGRPFEDLARQLGSDTAAWYSERHLARTEEPTFWAGNQPPRLLARAAEPDAAPDSNATPGGTGAGGDKGGASVNSTGPGTPSSAPAKRPAQWSGIQPVEPVQYADADGVVLRQRLICTLGSAPALVTEQDQYIQVLTVEGKKLGDFDVLYSPPEEEIEFLDCEVLRPDGTLLRSDPDSAGEAQERSEGDYRASRRRVFSLPGVVPGAVLHVRYRTQWKEFPLPQISMALPLARELPVIDSTLEVNVPKQAPFHFAFRGLAAPDPVVKQTDYSTRYSWHFEKLAARPREVLAPPDEGARILFSTFSDWAAFADWYGRITRMTAEPTPEILARAEELTRAATNDTGKILAVYNYVTALRYVAVPLGVNSLRPHAAANVLRNQFGDCKDKANLFNALLRAVHLEADLVLVPRFGQADDLVPGFAFNHAISRVTLGGQPLWVDTTDDICRFGWLPPGDPGRKVLVVDGKTASLTQLPAGEASQNVLELRGELDATGATQPWPVRLKAVAHGYPDYQLREAARETRDDHGAVPLLALRWRPASGIFVMESQTMTPVSGLGEDFTWHAAGTVVGLSSSTAEGRRLRSPFWLPKEWDLAVHHRRSPLFLNQGYPLTIEEEFQVTLPPGGSDAELPAPCENVQPPLRWRIEWARVADEKLMARFHAELARGELSLEETSTFQQQVKNLQAAIAGDAGFAPKQNPAGK